MKNCSRFRGKTSGTKTNLTENADSNFLKRPNKRHFKPNHADKYGSFSKPPLIGFSYLKMTTRIPEAQDSLKELRKMYFPK